MTEEEAAAARVQAFRDDAVCPECREGKHRNCNGDAWSNVLDEVVSCNCRTLGRHGDRETKQEQEALADLDPDAPKGGEN